MFQHRRIGRRSIGSVFILGLCLGLLTGCEGEVTPRKAYQNCVAKQMRQMQKNLRGEISNFANDLHSRIAVQNCDDILAACDGDPEGPACRKFLKRNSKTPKKSPQHR